MLSLVLYSLGQPPDPVQGSTDQCVAANPGLPSSAGSCEHAYSMFADYMGGGVGSIGRPLLYIGQLVEWPRPLL